MLSKNLTKTNISSLQNVSRVYSTYAAHRSDCSEVCNTHMLSKHILFNSLQNLVLVAVRESTGAVIETYESWGTFLILKVNCSN